MSNTLTHVVTKIGRLNQLLNREGNYNEVGAFVLVSVASEVRLYRLEQVKDATGATHQLTPRLSIAALNHYINGLLTGIELSSSL
jgi:hypothetical protein